MITVLLTCIVLAGNPFVPPKEWSVDKIEVPQRLVYNLSWSICSLGEICTYEEPSKNTSVKVYLRRMLNPGDRVDTPERCQVAVEVPQ